MAEYEALARKASSFSASPIGVTEHACASLSGAKARSFPKRQETRRCIKDSLSIDGISCAAPRLGSPYTPFSGDKIYRQSAQRKRARPNQTETS
jgi:hypothetical protein